MTSRKYSSAVPISLALPDDVLREASFELARPFAESAMVLIAAKWEDMWGKEEECSKVPGAPWGLLGPEALENERPLKTLKKKSSF